MRAFDTTNPQLNAVLAARKRAKDLPKVELIKELVETRKRDCIPGFDMSLPAKAFLFFYMVRSGAVEGERCLQGVRRPATLSFGRNTKAPTA